jgi:hypothetical protein
MGMMFRSLARMAMAGIALAIVRRLLRSGGQRRVDTIADLPNNS